MSRLNTRDKQKNLQRVAQRRQPDAAVLLMLLMAIHFIRMTGITAIQRMGQYMAQRHIQQRTAHHTKNRFTKQEYHQAGPLGRFCRQQRHRFIAGSNKDSQQRCGCDDPAGVQVGRHCTEPALGHTAQDCAGHKTQRPPPARACSIRPRGGVPAIRSTGTPDTKTAAFLRCRSKHPAAHLQIIP